MAASIKSTDIIQVQTTATVIAADPNGDVKVIMTIANLSGGSSTINLYRDAATLTPAAGNQILSWTLDDEETQTFALYLQDGDEIAATCSTNDDFNVTVDIMEV